MSPTGSITGDTIIGFALLVLIFSFRDYLNINEKIEYLKAKMETIFYICLGAIILTAVGFLISMSV